MGRPESARGFKQGLGRRRKVELREVVNGILYQTKNNCTWADLPRDFPPKSTVQDYYYAWIGDGSWQRWLGLLRQQVRVEAGREPTPSAGCVDSQSVPISHIGGVKGVDGGKKVKGRKRHILTDTLGLLLAVVVTAANIDDAAAASRVLAKVDPTAYPRLAAVANEWARLLGDAATFPQDHAGLVRLCNQRGQSKPTPLILRYQAGGWNALHQDLYGEVAFPLQLTVALTRPEVDFAGGENLFVEQRPRSQSRGTSLVVPRGHEDGHA